MSVVNIQEKFNLFQDQWSPKKIGELNRQQILLAKIKGEFVFHKHDNEDELFMVKKGMEHKPVAKEEVHILLFELLSTKHTGDIKTNITVENYEEI